MAEETIGEEIPPEEAVARRYDPDRLRRLVIRAAGRIESLDLGTRSAIERRLPGFDSSSVRIIRGPLAEEVTARHRADAVTVGSTVLVRDGARAAPGTTSRQALLAHELMHVAQARAGMEFAHEHGTADPPHEREAEVLERAVAAAPTPADDTSLRRTSHRRRIVERCLALLEEEHRQTRERCG